jgi:hypothetical protein
LGSKTSLSAAAIVFTIGAASGTAFGAVAEPNSVEFCFSQLLNRYESCDNQVGPGGTTPRTTVHRVCTDGAVEWFASCVAGDAEDNRQRRDIWDSFHTLLASCYQNFRSDPAALQSCIHALLRGLRIQLCMLDGGTAIECNPPGGGGSGCGTYDTASALSVDGGPADPADPAFPQLQSVAAFASSVVSTGTGQPIHPTCAGGSLMLLVYEGPTGVEVVAVDADATPGDGLTMEVDLSRFDLNNSAVVGVIELHIGVDGLPTKGAAVAVKIKDGAGKADWNRDGVLSPLDVIEYLDSYDAGASRADLDESEAVDGADLAEYLVEYAGG